jgi:hypothetical protein
MRENGLNEVSYDMLVKEYGAVVGCDHKLIRKGDFIKLNDNEVIRSIFTVYFKNT